MEEYEMVRWQEKEELTFEMLSTASTYWDWILPALVRKGDEVPIQIHKLTIVDIVKEFVEEETVGKLTKTILENWDTEKIYDPVVSEKIREQFGYTYPYVSSYTQKLKFTVSELKKRTYQMEQTEESEGELGELLYEETEVVPLLPKFMQETDELTGASRGTAYHRVMELLDFSQEYKEETLKIQLKMYVETGKMTQDMADCIRKKDILFFLNTRTGERMKRSAGKRLLWKEQPFVLGVDAKEIYDGEQERELILVQGIIDAYFEEEGELVVLDYKTDQIYDENELAEKYHAQLDYYARALEQMSGKKVKEKIIYSFTMRKEISI